VSRPYLNTILRHAQALATDETPSSDADLLERFRTTRDERAFSAIVNRHGAMVWSVCRNLLASDADSDDAFQATFLALVRDGHRIRNGDRLASWLHGAALRIALKLRRSTARRVSRETAAATNEIDRPVADGAWGDLLAAVHEEVDRLPESLRSAFVLCCLEGERGADAARRLGIAPNALAARLVRARQRVLDNLARRGIAVGSATAAIGSAAATADAAVPSAVLGQTLAFASTTDSVSPIVLSLAKGALDMNTRVKWITAALLVATAMTTTIGTLILSSATGQVPDGGQPGRAGRGGGGGAATGSPNSPAALAARMPVQWEYKVVRIFLQTAESEKELNKLGEDGWELTLSNDQGNLVLKRQKPRSFPFGGGGGFGSGGSVGDGGTGSSGTSGGVGAAGGGSSGGGPIPDKKADSTHVISIKHAKATALAATIAPLLGSDEGTGRRGFDAGGFSPGVRRTASGRLSIAVDERTNSIIVIADDATFKTIKELVEKLDVAIKDEPRK
jgi:RNA polymerase sigma factor (sigma-70 family)